MNTKTIDHTAQRVALWRALHLKIDAPPYILEDFYAEDISNAGSDWRNRPDMNPEGCRIPRANTVARAKLVEDMLDKEIQQDMKQYVLLGSGLDTFLLRKLENYKNLSLFEIDRQHNLDWKKNRIKELKLPFPERAHFLGVDFENNQKWWDVLKSSSFKSNEKSFIVSTGVSMYLTDEANKETITAISKFPKGTVFAMTFMLSLDLMEPEIRALQEMTMKYAAAANTPFISFYYPEDLVNFAKKLGFSEASTIQGKQYNEMYFKNRTDHLKAVDAEAVLILKI